MSTPSEREIERRIERLKESTTEPPDADWLDWVPRELWRDRVEAWRYFITSGESHPELEPANGDK